MANTFYRQHGSAMKARDVHQVWAAGVPDSGSPEFGIAEIAACACLQAIPGDSGHWLTSLFVDPDLRRRGLAGRLLSQIRGDNSGAIWLFCRPELAPLYHRHGYQFASQMPESLASKLRRYQREKQLIALVNHG